jgi:tRNA threonylcarbamoyladenosine biosynthesis protein TsaB
MFVIFTQLGGTMANHRGNAFSCLAVESASPVCSIAACRDGQVSSHSGSSGADQSRDIYAAVAKVLEELNLRLPDLDCIAFGRGPGGFTGLRVGAAVVQALSYGASIPVCSISSLAGTALACVERHGFGTVAVCTDARMGEAYLAIYRVSDHDPVSVVLEDCLVDPASFSIDPSLTFFAAGPGWLEYPELFDRHREHISGSDPEFVPTARCLLTLAEARYLDGETCLPGEAVPNYIRDKVTG